jgi:hypothetical protein
MAFQSDTSSAKQYAYTSLTREREIRLLALEPAAFDGNLSCHLMIASLDDPPPFEALSYVWGDPEPRMQVLCDGDIFEIGPKLDVALRHLRYEAKERVIWVDALCIDQENDQERTQQVQLMGDIYSSAVQTLIWLGEETDDVKTSFDELKQFIDRLPRGLDLSAFDPTVSMEVPQFLLDGLASREQIPLSGIANLLARPWFGRKWVIQEVIKSKSPLVLLGHQSIEWRYFQDFWTGTLFFNNIPALMSESMSNLAVSKHLSNLSMLATLGGLSTPLYFQIALSTGFSCTDPRDHIIALLGLATDIPRDEAAILADYSVSAEEICARLAILMIFQHGSLDILSLHNSIPVESRVPSWVPPFSNLPYEGPSTMLQTITTPLASKSTNVFPELSEDGALLSLRGRIVDKITTAGSVSPFRSISHWEQQGEGNGTFLEILGDWLVECEEIAKKAKPSVKASSEKNQGILDEDLGIGNLTLEPGLDITARESGLDEFKRAIALDTGETLTQDFVDEYFTLLKYVQNLEETLDNIMSADEFFTLANRHDTRLKLLGFRRFCSTEKERIGWMAMHVEVGDLVCVFDGGDMAYVIRPSDEGRYKIVGDCFVRGIMNGETLDDPDISSEMITLE